MRTIVFSLLFLVFISHQACAQIEIDTIRYQITTSDGNKYLGTIVHQDSESILFNADVLGEITIPKKEVLRLEQVKLGHTGVYESQLWPYHIQSSRYFFNPSGYGIKKGEGYYQNTWIFFNQVSYGLTDHFSIGAGVVPLFLFFGAPTPVWVMPRFSIPIAENKFNLGLGGLFGTIAGVDNTGFGLVNGVATIGTRDKNISIGLMYGLADGDLTRLPLITLSGLLRTGERGYLISELFLLPGEGGGVFSFGARRLIQRVGLDFGGFVFLGDMDGPTTLPWLGVSVPFGQ